jgi:predicted RNA-binding Zn-ribbon protein involved in translation (DUF1610 family)
VQVDQVIRGDTTMKKCPVCKELTMQDENVRNFLSRRDNKTYICNGCGTQEALDDSNLNQEAKEAVIKLLNDANLIDTDDFD